MGDLATNLRELTDSQIRALDFVTPAILESVEIENDEPLGVVRMLGDEQRLVDKIPLWTYYAGDGYGHEQALHPPERGILVCLDYPLEEARRDDEPPAEEGLNAGRHHALQDAFFYPTVRKESEAGLGSPLGADWLRHRSGTERRITETGDYEIEHHAGHTVLIHEDVVEVRFARSDGETMALFTDGEQVAFDGPNEYLEFLDDPRTRMGIRDDGTSWLGGFSRIGPETANRVDRTREEPDVDSPFTYVQQDERIAPIADPSDDGETQYDNPAMASLTAPLDGGLYEARRLLPFARREGDPDPTVTDVTDPAFIDLPDDLRAQGVLPEFYMWINVTDGVLRWWNDGAPEDLLP